MQYNLIDHNYFHDFPFFNGNGHEPMNIGRGPEDSLVPCFTTVEYNLFENVLGDEETISVKSSENTIQFNTFKRNFRDHDDRDERRYCQLNLRHGTRNRVLGNTLIDMALLNIRGDDHLVGGNRLITTGASTNDDLSNIRVSCGNVWNTLGSWKAGQTDTVHPTARDCTVVENKLDGDFEIGFSFTGNHRLKAENTIHQANKVGGRVRFDRQKGTKSSGFEGFIPKSVEMTKDDVGVNAPVELLVRLSQTLRDDDEIGPGEFEWFAEINPEDDNAAVLFLVDGEEVNREVSKPYGDRRNNHVDFFNWKDTSRYGAGEHRMTVRLEGTDVEETITVKMKG